MRTLFQLRWWFWLVFAGVGGASGQPYEAGQVYFGRNGYVEYRAGNLPLILTAGHGGALEPEEIPDRTYGVTVTDTNTRELTIACWEEIFTRTGRRPHLVICHLKRTKLDVNREVVEAAQGNEYAEQAWAEYHGFIEAARASEEAERGFGLVIDIHGHGHSIQRLELGYALGAAELNLTDAQLNHPGYAWMSTLRTLLTRRFGVSFAELIRGPRSLGDLFNLRNVPAWPSPQFPTVGGAPFFSGGYTVRTHSCLHDNGPIHGVQIEAHWTGVRATAAERTAFAERFANVMQPYFWDNYGYDLGTLSLSRLEPPPTVELVRGGGVVTITVRRSGYLGLSTNLALGFGGSAELGEDYTVSGQSVFMAAGVGEASFSLTPQPVGAAFGDRVVEVSLAPSRTQTADLERLRLVLHDGVTPVVRVKAEAEMVTEGVGETGFWVTRTGGAGAVTVPLMWGGTALRELDYEAPVDEVRLEEGEGAKRVVVKWVDDGRAEPDKTLSLTVGEGEGWVSGEAATATVLLLDDDRPVGLAVWLRGESAGNRVRDDAGWGRDGTGLPADGSDGQGPTSFADASTGGEPALGFDGVMNTVAMPRFDWEGEGGAFSVAFWFRLEASGAVVDQSLLSYGARGQAGSLHVYLQATQPNDQTVALRTNFPGFSAGALDVARVAPLRWRDGVWRHYGLTVGADGVARVFVDGELRRTASGRVGRLAVNQLGWLGWRPAAGGGAEGFMRGAMREVRVYQRAITSAEVVAEATGVQTFAAWWGATRGEVAGGEEPTGAWLEYGLSARLEREGDGPRQSVALSEGRLGLGFLRRPEAADVVFTVEAADTPAGPWAGLVRRGAGAGDWVVLTSGAEVWEMNGYVRVMDVPEAAMLPRRFMRVRVEAGP